MPQNSTSQDLGNGVARESLFDGRLVILTLSSVARTAIDRWGEALDAEMKSWPPDRPICLMFDQSSLSNVTITPYMRSRISELSHHSRGKSGRTAIVFGKNFFLQYAINVMNNEVTRTDLESKFFSNRDEAIAWLGEIVEPKP